jgi:nicotinamidase-related amidase
VTVPDPLEPSRTAVLLMDYQNGIIERFAGTDPELLDRAAAAIDTARGAGATIGYVRVALDPAEAAAVPASNKAFTAAAARGSMGVDDPATAVAGAIAPRAGDIVVRKKRVGAFSTTDLDAQLRERDIDTLVLGGISTSGVVLSTVRDAADRDYRVVLLEDLCVDSDEEVHRVLFGKVFPRQADVIASDHLAELLSRRTS